MPRSNRITLGPSSFTGVTLVGGGPGDADLITVAGLKALLAADVVVTDRLAPRALLAELDPSIEVIDVAKVPRSRFTAQEEINRLLIERSRSGKNVVRLKGGDGYVFGRGFEELLALQEAGVPVRVIPGLSSSISVPALAGIPITHRGVVHEFTVVSGHLPPDHPSSLIDWAGLARMRGTLVLLMAVENVRVHRHGADEWWPECGYARGSHLRRFAADRTHHHLVPWPARLRCRRRERRATCDHRDR